jgi:hypothetical protein
MTLTPGARLGPHEIVAHIGSGGMGQVWRARAMNLWRIAVDQNTGAAIGSPERLTMGTETHFGISPEANGSFVFPARGRV